MQNRLVLPVENKLRAFGVAEYVAPSGVFSPRLSQRYARQSSDRGPVSFEPVSHGDEIVLPVQNSLAFDQSVIDALIPASSLPVELKMAIL